MGSEVVTPEGFKLYFHKAKVKTQPETVVFIHHMYGNYKTTWRHYRTLNDWGYDCVTFDLLYGSRHRRKKNQKHHPFLRYAYRGLFNVWRKQIESIFDFVDGDKIAYSFSAPSLATLLASHSRADIKKVICDGGPFGDLYANTRNFFYYETDIKNDLLNRLISVYGVSLWGWRPDLKLHKSLKKWNTQIPILSIRGSQDEIVFIDSIRKIFNPHSHINLSVLELDEGRHLDGLSRFPDLYTRALKEHLNS